MSALATPNAANAPTAHKPAARLDSALQTFALDRVLNRARACLLDLQKPDGHWCGELQGDTILESEFILLMAFLGREREDKVRKAANYILTQERPGGGWANHPGGPVDINVSVKAYFALKLAGHAAEAPHLQKARAAIRALGGAIQCNSYTKFYLSALGQFPYDNCAAVPPEMIFLPKWCYFNLYAMSSWTRTIVVPLSLFYAHKPVRQLPRELGIAELFLESPSKPCWPATPTRRLLTWPNVFLALDRVIKWFEVSGPQWIRRKAIELCAKWMIDHFKESDGVGAIFPPIIYTIISLHCLKYPVDSPEMQYALKQLDDLMIEERDTLRIQPCFSPVWDTALSLNALAMAESSTQRKQVHDSMAAAAQWLLDREVRTPGDWSLMNPGLEPTGWFFEYKNAFYPDIDDTAMVLMGLARSGMSSPGVRYSEPLGSEAPTPGVRYSEPLGLPPIPACERALKWLLAMQNIDGGWAAFDRDINHEVLTMVPFADHNAMLDPSCPDITARVLEALGLFGIRVGHPAVERGFDFIAKTQDPRGCWIGRWGVNYLYGTWQVLQGLEAAGHDMKSPMVRRAVEWVKSVQQSNGGWGETCFSYDDPSLAGQGEVTASQTAWALLGLIAAGEADSEPCRRGIQYLISTQGDDGNWVEEPFTGTGFPKVFYLRYHMYRLYFPLMALARFKRATTKELVNYEWQGAAHEVSGQGESRKHESTKARNEMQS